MKSRQCGWSWLLIGWSVYHMWQAISPCLLWDVSTCRWQKKLPPLGLCFFNWSFCHPVGASGDAAGPIWSQTTKTLLKIWAWIAQCFHIKNWSDQRHLHWVVLCQAGKAVLRVALRVFFSVSLFKVNSCLEGILPCSVPELSACSFHFPVPCCWAFSFLPFGSEFLSWVSKREHFLSSMSTYSAFSFPCGLLQSFPFF